MPALGKQVRTGLLPPVTRLWSRARRRGTKGHDLRASHSRPGHRPGGARGRRARRRHRRVGPRAGGASARARHPRPAPLAPGPRQAGQCAAGARLPAGRPGADGPPGAAAAAAPRGGRGARAAVVAQPPAAAAPDRRGAHRRRAVGRVLLPGAGADVIVLEKGGYASESDFSHQEAEATRGIYLYGLTLATTDLGVRIVAGSTLGGGTVVNYSTSFKTPPFGLAEWARVSGSDLFVSGEVEASLEAVAERLGVTGEASRPGARDELMEAGLRKLGWHVDGMPRNVRGCSQDAACGFCGFGCRLGAKQSTMRTYLEDAAERGTRLVV